MAVIQETLFTDDNFVGESKNGFLRAKEFARALAQRDLDIRFNMEMRVTDVTRELLSDLKRVGLNTINLGVESGSQSMLDRWKKGITVDDSIRAIRTAESVGVNFNVNYILLDAYTTISELFESYIFLKKMRIVERTEEFFDLFTNEMGVIHGTCLSKSMENTDLLLPYKMQLATPEEQKLLDDFHPVYSYRFTDPHIEVFVKNNRHRTQKAEMIIRNQPPEVAYSKGFRHFCFKLFSMSVESAERYEIIIDTLDKEMEQFCKIRNISCFEQVK